MILSINCQRGSTFSSDSASAAESDLVDLHLETQRSTRATRIIARPLLSEIEDGTPERVSKQHERDSPFPRVQ